MTTGLKALAALFIGTTGVLLAGEPPSSLPENKGQKTDAKANASPLEGLYTIVSGEKDGKSIPAERIKGSIIGFAGDRIIGTDKDKKEFFAATYTLNTSKKPWVIKMKSTSPKEAEATGLIMKDGETLTIIYALPGGDSPTEFKTKDKQHLFVMKAANKAPPTEKPKP